MGMGIDYVFAGLVVSDRDDAVAFYGRLLGKPPDFLPNDHEAVWQLAATASLYVLADPERAGRGVMTIAVDDLDAYRADVADRGIDPGPIQILAGIGRESFVTDPDGNVVTLAEITAGG